MSDLDKKYPLRLDTRIDFKNLIPHFYISDNETSDFYIKFTNDNQPVLVENVVIAIVVVNPNSQINSSLLDVNIDKGLIYCNLPNELKNVVGVYKAKIMCISEEERLVSNTFEYKVDMDEFAILNEVVEGSDEILLLTQMLSQFNIISTEEGKRIENENIRLVNETERITNETNRINNEDERKSNELERITNETKRNNDENERQLKETERNESELNRESQELIRQNNELDRIAYDEVIENNENERRLKESERISNEESRIESENVRNMNENNRKNDEQMRQNNEDNRKFEFTAMKESLNNLALDVNIIKNDILNGESNRVLSEEDRKSTEKLRINNEDVRITNEEARVKNEDTRLKSEEIRVSNEDTRERSENARKTNENTRVSNENKRITAESTRSSNENIRVNAENRRRNEHTARMEEIDEALANLPNSLPVANQTNLGGIKVGAGLSITADGILSTTGGGGTADSVTWENVVGRPTKMSEFANDSGFITSIPSEYITETELDAKGYLTEHQDLSGYAPLDSPNFTNSISMGRKEGTTVGECSIALGGVDKNKGTIEASGNYSIATGFYSVAKGAYSHAEGFQTKANKNSSHAEGVMTTTDSTGAHAEGGNTVARGYFSHSEGHQTIASGEYQHVQGKYNIEDTENKYAHIVGNGASNTERSNAHTLDWNGNAWYKGKLSQEGSPTADNDLTTKKYVDNAISNMSTSGGSGDGFNTISSNLILSLTASEIQNSIDSGTEITLSSLDGIFDENKRYIVEFLGERKLSSIYPTNNNEVIHWNISCNFGDSLVDLYYSTSDNVMKLGIVKKNTDTTITATDFKVYEETVVPFDAKYLPMNLTMQNSISMGRIGEIGSYSIALGFCTEASGIYSFSQGRKTTATGGHSHAEGYDTTASGNASHTEGIGTTASGNGSHAEGYGTKASNHYSHSEGYGTTASGIISHAEGFGTKAIGGYSHVEGSYTTASSSNQHVQGKYNIEDTENKYAHIVGNGTSDTARSNAHTLDWNGNGWYKGKLSQDGVPTEDKDLTTKRYVDGKVAEIVNSAPETLDTLNELATALGNDPNFATTVSTQIGNKVDKVTGKGLSTNDLTDALKSNYDTAYTHSQSTHFSGNYNDLTNKPTIPTAYTHPTTHPASMITGLATVATSGNYNDLTNLPTIPEQFVLPIANQTTLGGIKVGAGLSITADGILSATGGGTADSTNKYDNSNKYDNPYKNKGSVVVKMQTHCHTTNSDGIGTLEQVINAYKSKGFNAICITDHDMITDTNAYNTSDFITILGTEHSVGSLGSLTARHMSVINTNYVSEKGTPFEVYQDYKSNKSKSFTVKNHPHDTPLSNYEVSYDNGDYLCDAIEIYNGKRQTGYLYAFWRAIETGHKIKHVATDDFHDASATVTDKMTSSGNPIEIQTITGWIKLYCEEFSKQGIMDALYKGSYISCIGHDMDIESGDDYIRATTEIPSNFRFVDKNGLVLKEEKNVMTSEYIFNGFEELIMVISQPVDNPAKYAISQCIFNNDVFGKEHKQVINDKMLCEKIITDKFTPKYHMVNNEEYVDYPFLHIKNLELYGKTVADYTNRTFKHSRAIMAFNDEYLTLSSELLKQGDYIKDGCLYKNTDEITIDGTWNIEFYKTYTNVNQFRIEIQDKFFKPRGDRIIMCNYAPRINEYGSSNPVVGLYLSTGSTPRYITLQLDKTEFPNVDTLKAKLNETPLRILYSTFETKVIKLPKEYYIDTLGANEINVMTEASAFSFDMVHNKDINAPEYGQVSKISMTLIPGEFAYDGTGDGISMNIDGTNYTLSNYNMRHYDYIKDNTIYKCGKVYSYNDFTVVTKLKSTNYFRVEFPADATPNFINSMVTGNEAMSEKESPFEKDGKTYLYIYYKDVPPYTQTNFPTLDNLKALFAEKYPDFKVYLKYKDAIGTENITLPQASITKDSIIKMNGKYESCLFKIN